MESLYDRLGGTEGMKAIASDPVDTHVEHPVIAPRYSAIDIVLVQQQPLQQSRLNTDRMQSYERA